VQVVDRSSRSSLVGDWLESVAVLFNIRHLYSEVKLCVCTRKWTV